jgi:hypothetical protein
MSRLIAVAALAALGSALAGCATGPVDDPRMGYAGEPLEPVLAFREDATGDLVLRVQSNGCTTKDSFDVAVTGSAAGGWTFDMALTRLHADRCRAFLPQGVALTWTKDELGLPPSAAVNLVNPVQNTAPQRRPLPAYR